MSSASLENAFAVLRENDRGTYTVPTKGLYPFQWNWDSCLTALGLAAISQDRAWTEIETLFEHQWPDGMVPQIVFHVPSDTYFPGPDIWQTNRPTPTSGITQPAVAGFAVRRLFDRAQDRHTDRAMAETRSRALLHKIDAWHAWFYRNRDPHGEGLVAILHPWEAGRDNSVDWDEALAQVPTSGITPYRRRDTDHANPAHRPTDAQYDAFVWLVEHFRRLGWDNSLLHDASPFRVVDPAFNAILIRSCADLAAVAEALGEKTLAQRNRAWAQRSLDALDALWHVSSQRYQGFNRATGERIDSRSIGGLLPILAAIPPARAAAIAGQIAAMGEQMHFLVPSHDPGAPGYEAQRYWRGPIWLITNFLIENGLRQAGQTEVADRIVRSSLDLIEKSGFAEYYEPQTGAALGGGRFTWTAAMVIEFLTRR
ncbi:hypothetical protein IC608_06575 [Devosia sp. PTR5]|uniref:Mannosylglycerate hydrolase MGH1-like glycoside hydrolase domain-containing protein n=2 Tax=Devosia oryzisoli TaxID=2774138 RepID=A0A927ISU9_9HYPH|nr:hypothetical protein [Devosia oryzisoli]